MVNHRPSRRAAEDGQSRRGSVDVDLRQVVEDLEGRTLIDETVKHAFRLDGGHVRRFNIQCDTQLTGIHSAT
jgi:hypothetical protein